MSLQKSCNDWRHEIVAAMQLALHCDSRQSLRAHGSREVSEGTSRCNSIRTVQMPFGREEEVQHRVQEISNQLQTLTEQLNKFKPTSEHAVGVSHEKLSDQVQQRLDAQADRIYKLSETVLEGQKDDTNQC